MTRASIHHVRPLILVLGVLAVSSGALVGPGPVAQATTTHVGTVRVLSAGSLSNVMVSLAGAFKHDTGYAVVNTAEGSSAIASGIVAKTLQGDVFISAAPSADQSIMGVTNGGWINGYTTLGTSPDVLAYYPKSKFAAALRTRPWYEVIQSPGFELGRTDPAVDPSGVLDVDALYGIGYGYQMPRLVSMATATNNVYTEEAIPGLLAAGQLDAGFMYAVSADAATLPYVALVGTRHLSAHYTVARLNRAPDPVPAAAFVKWLRSSRGLSIMRRAGLVPVGVASGTTPK